MFALQPGANTAGGTDIPRGGRLISVSELNLPGVDGLTLRHRRQWPDSFIDECRARVYQAGDFWTLLVMGSDTPQPWTDASLRGWEATISRLSFKYAADPRLVAVHVTGCTPYRGASEELHWDRPVSARVEAANKWLISKWAAAFPRQTIILAISGKDPACMERLIAYGLTVAPGRFLTKHNAMKASTSLSAPHNQIVVRAGRRGSMVGFEMVGATRESRFGGTFAQAMANAYTVATQAGQPLSYAAIYPDDLDKLGAYP
jgi:hypothetical protein